MHTKARTVKVPEITAEENPYVLLIQAIIARALDDARGEATPRMAHHSRAALQAEARDWLADEQSVAELVELTGHDASPVLHRIRQLLETTTISQ